MLPLSLQPPSSPPYYVQLTQCAINDGLHLQSHLLIRSRCAHSMSSSLKCCLVGMIHITFLWLLKCPVDISLYPVSPPHHLIARCGRAQDPRGLWSHEINPKSQNHHLVKHASNTKLQVRKKGLECWSTKRLFVTALACPG